LDFALRWTDAETIEGFALFPLLASQSLSTTMEPGCTAIDDVLLKRCHSESSDTASKTISK
jgi:hypothetical protein